MNEFSQTSLKGQGLQLLEQGIARVAWRGSIVQNCDLNPACSTGWFSCCLEVVDPAEL